MAGLLDFLQGMSNSAASTVSAPIDGVNWALGKMGLPVSQAPFGGSAWMAQKGLTAEPQNRNVGLLGEAVGGVLPMIAAAKAPQIAKGILQGAENLMAPRVLDPMKQRGAIFYHGTNDYKPVTQITDGGTFGGLFSHALDDVAATHGKSIYRMTVPDENIMRMSDSFRPSVLKSVIAENTRPVRGVKGLLSEYIENGDSMYSHLMDNGEIDKAGQKLLEALRASDLGEASWELQRLRGLAAKKQGFQAVAMPDEHGISYLVLPGVTPRPFNESAKNLVRGK